MYLLDADGDQFSTVVSRVPNDLLYTQVATPHGTDFSHGATGFSGNWQPMTCDVDTIFKVAVIPLTVSGSDMYTTKPLVTIPTLLLSSLSLSLSLSDLAQDNKVINLIPPMIYTGRDFGDFKGDSRPSSRASEFFNQQDSSHQDQTEPSSASASLERKNPPALLENNLSSEGRVRFADRQIAATEFSDDDETYRQTKLDPPALTTPEISARRPHSGSKSSSPGKQKKDKPTSAGRKSSNQPQPQSQPQSAPQRNPKSGTLPSIIGLNEDKPKVPFDTMKALQGTEYRPRSPKHMINIERSFSNA
jgi:hypothetical protein